MRVIAHDGTMKLQEAERMDHHSDGPLIEALAKCGVDPALVEVEWDELCQEEVLT